MAVIDRVIHNIPLNEGVNVNHSENGLVTISGEKGSVSREFIHHKVVIPLFYICVHLFDKKIHTIL